jgi:hypothetical protein
MLGEKMVDQTIKNMVNCYEEHLKQINILKRELTPRVWDVAQRYIDKKIDIENATGHHADDYPGGEIKYCGRYGISHDDSKVIINWEESWSYGGYDSGTFSFPLTYLYDEEVFLEFLKSEDDRKQEILEKIREKTINEKRKMVEKLQKELESI